MPFIYVSKFANGDSRSQVFPVRVGVLRPAMQRVEERKRFDLDTGFVRKGTPHATVGRWSRDACSKVFAPTSFDRVVHMFSWHFHPTAGFLNAPKLQNVPSPLWPQSQKPRNMEEGVLECPQSGGFSVSYSAPKMELSE